MVGTGTSWADAAGTVAVPAGERALLRVHPASPMPVVADRGSAIELPAARFADGRQEDVARLSWVLTDGRAGDDAQLVRIAAALGWPHQVVFARQSVPEVVRGRLFDAFGANRLPDSARPANGIWPDVVLAAGGRNVSFARAIKNASGGKAHLVFLGGPYAELNDFDLVVTTPQWRLPARRNVVHNMLPLNWPEPKQVADAAIRWQDELAHLPHPWLAVLVGGNNSSFSVTVGSARKLAQRVNEIVKSTGGSVLVTTSRRTPVRAADALAAAIDVPHHVYRWRAGDTRNPYLAYLALADRFLVTNESASMIADALNTGRPVELFRLRQRAVSRLLTSPWIAGADVPDERQYAGATFADRVRRWLIERGFWTPARDLQRLCRMLEEKKLLGADGIGTGASPCEADLQRTVERIRGLFGGGTVPAPDKHAPGRGR